MNRRRYTQEFKQLVVLEAQEAGNVTQVAREYTISPNLLYAWIKKFKYLDWKHPEATKVPASASTVDEYCNLDCRRGSSRLVLSEKNGNYMNKSLAYAARPSLSGKKTFPPF